VDATELKKFISAFAEPPASEWLAFARKLRIRKLEPGEVFFEQGASFSDHNAVGFVLSGLIYTHYTDRAGHVAIKNFAWEGRLIAPYASLLLKQPTSFTAKAWEKSWVATIPFGELNEFYDRHKSWERLGRKAAEKLLIERERREYESLFLDARQRWVSFTKYYAPIIDRIPQWMIASFIGITPVALSRILNSPNPSAENLELPFPDDESDVRPRT
jgi:CRP-like cAMP-binding protein